MAVKIPRLQQIQPSGTPAAPRINARVQPQADLISRNAQNLTSLVGEGNKLYEDIRDAKASTAVRDLEIAHRDWQDPSLKKAATHQGDSKSIIDLYKQLDEDDNKKSAELLAKYSDYDEDLQERIKAKFESYRKSQRYKVLTQRGAHIEKQNTQTYNAIRQLNKNDLAVNALDSDAYDATIAKIKEDHLNRGIETGAIVRVQGKDGSVTHKRSNVSQLNLVKDLDEGITNSINVLIDSKQRARAEEILKTYDKNITESSKAKIRKKLDVDKTEREADEFINNDKFRIADKNKQDEMISRIKDKDIKEEVNQRIISRRSQIERDRKAQSGKFTDDIIMTILKMKESGKAPATMSELKSIPDIKQKLNHVNVAKDYQAILKTINPPKGDSKVSFMTEFEVAEKFNTGEIYELPPEQVQKLLANLPEKKAEDYRNMYFKDKKASPAQQTTVNKMGRRLVRSSLMRLGVIDYPSEDYKNGFSDDDNKVIVDYEREVLKWMSDLGADRIKEESLQKFIDDMVLATDKKDKKKLESLSIRDYLPGTVVEKKEDKPKRPNRAALMIKYRETYPDRPRPRLNSKEFNDFLKLMGWVRNDG